MKIFNILIVFTIIGFSIASCDKIEAPYKEGNEKPVDTSATYVKKVLLEDLTGHKCVNCPSAHAIAHELQDIYGEENLIVVAVHAGWFSSPGNAPYDYDFQTEAGTEYANTFGAQSYPIGMVDRVNDGGNYLLDKDKWGTISSQQFDEDVQVGIEISCNLQAEKLSGEINLEFISDYNSVTNIQIWIIEDHIIKTQLTPDGDDEAYEHNHVLRGAVNGTWGESLPQATYTSGATETINFSDYQLGNDWVDTELSIIAFVYDFESKRVIQVEQKKIIE